MLLILYGALFLILTIIMVVRLIFPPKFNSAHNYWGYRTVTAHKSAGNWRLAQKVSAWYGLITNGGSLIFVILHPSINAATFADMLIFNVLSLIVVTEVSLFLYNRKKNKEHV